jgi:hypothetical protein
MAVKRGFFRICIVLSVLGVLPALAGLYEVGGPLVRYGISIFRDPGIQFVTAPNDEYYVVVSPRNWSTETILAAVQSLPASDKNRLPSLAFPTGQHLPQDILYNVLHGQGSDEEAAKLTRLYHQLSDADSGHNEALARKTADTIATEYRSLNEKHGIKNSPNAKEVGFIWYPAKLTRVYVSASDRDKLSEGGILIAISIALCAFIWATFFTISWVIAGFRTS